MQFSWAHIDAVADGAALPLPLAAAGFSREADIERTPDLRPAEQRQPFELTLSEPPFSFLDLGRSGDALAVVVVELKGSGWAGPFDGPLYIPMVAPSCVADLRSLAALRKCREMLTS